MKISPLLLAKEIEEYVINIRRDLHRNPEISGEEKRTIKTITTHLKELNIPYEIIDNGGIIGIIEGKAPGKSIILRGDIDALPMQEDTYNLNRKKAVVSEIDNVAHTCGHDGHTAMLLGAAKILTENKDHFNGKIILAFEQGEEDGRGIYRLLKRLVEIGADGVWGIHLKPDIPSMRISVNKGPRMASFFGFNIIIKGIGGHGSRPDLANSPLDAFTDFYQQLKSMRINTLNPFEPITFSIGNVQAGSTSNIIPETLNFSGTCRFLHYEQGKHAEQEFKRLLEKVCDLHQCSYEYVNEPTAMNVSVYNHDKCAAIAAESVIKSVGKEAIYEYPAWMASEPFAFYQKYFPGVFAFLGTENLDEGIGADNHNPKFDIDENVLKLGVAVTVKNALLFLKNQDKIVFTPETKSVKEIILESGLKIYE